ncbi:quinone oxidoreductase family protein [Krasilnikovia sp. MM14-A1004]|uniref:quinone oxidoreductase family protein n=1 Tax=Krasilnikovia sp. MM14-A1004 TaxID=3373541 RepID=UPI00399CD2A0
MEIDEPRPGPGEVSIEVAYAGINFADVMARRGDAGYGLAWPYIPGHEVCGVVRELGAGVRHLSVGQSVVALPGRGGLAEVVVAPAALTVVLPGGVQAHVAAGTPAATATAWLLLDDVARLRTGERVLVYSASGGVGAALAQLIPILGGGPSIGVVGTARQADVARAHGYDIVLTQHDALAEDIRAAASDGVDVILDPKGTELLATDLAVVAPGGRIVLFGNASGRQPAALPPAGHLLRGNVTISGFSIGSLSARAPQRVAEAMRRVLELIALGELTVPVTVLDSLAEVPAAQQLLAEARGQGKYVVRLAGD